MTTSTTIHAIYEKNVYAVSFFSLNLKKNVDCVKWFFSVCNVIVLMLNGKMHIVGLLGFLLVFTWNQPKQSNYNAINNKHTTNSSSVEK